MAPTANTRRSTRSSTQSQTTQTRSKAQQSSTKSTRNSSVAKISKPQKKANSQRKPSKEAKDAKIRQEKPAPIENPTFSSSRPSTHEAPLVFTVPSTTLKSPVLVHSYTPLIPKERLLGTPKDTILFTHGAGGTLDAPAVVNFCNGFRSITERRFLAFQGSSNLDARVRGFEACWEHVGQMDGGEGKRNVVFVGRSMGARAAVMAAERFEDGGKGSRLVLVSYPLQGPKDVRDRILLDLPESARVLFVVGDRDGMCPLDLLQDVRQKMKAKSQVVVVRGADHGMNVRPAARTGLLGERAGRVAARWVDERALEEVEEDEGGGDGVVYIGDIE